MEKSRKTKRIVLILLLLIVIGLSIGFATFTRDIKLQTSAEVKVKNTAFSVLFSTSDTGVVEGKPTYDANGYASGGTIGAQTTELTDLKATFDEPGQTATWEVYSYNAGQLSAFLNKVEVGALTCKPRAGTTADLAEKAMEGIELKVSVGGTEYAATSGEISEHELEAGHGEKVIVTLEYKAGSSVADGIFDIEIGDIILTYDSVDTE